MSLTGTSAPQGTQVAQESLNLDSAPDVYIQDTRGSYRYNPDTDSFYWGMSGSATYPAYKLGCFSDLTLGGDISVNDIICDAVGVEGVIQKMGSMHVNFTLKALFPMTVLTHLVRAGTVTQNSGDGAEKMGIGDVTRKNLYWRMYLAKVYDEDTGDYICFTFHKGQFVESWELATPFANQWAVPIKFRAFADTSKPVGQKFCTVIRVDPSVVT